MIMTLLISGVIMPAFIWLLLYCKITDQYIDNDGLLIMTQSKKDAQAEVLNKTLMSPFCWIYLLFSLCCIFAGICSINAFSLGDWFFSL